MLYIVSTLKELITISHWGQHRTINGTIEYFDENRGWIAAKEYFDMLEEKNDRDDPDMQPDYLSKQSGESEDNFNSRIRKSQIIDDDLIDD